MIRKASAALGLLVVAIVALGAMAVPAFATSPYPPIVTTTAPPATTTTTVASKLAFTGSNSVSLLVIALVAITVGVVTVVALRRRGSVQATKS